MIEAALFLDLSIRNCRSDDHGAVLSVMVPWWGGRDLAYALPRLFFDHFTDSSFVAYQKERLVGFLIGFLSQSDATAGYIHFAGVHPDLRQLGLGSHLFGLFFEHCRSRDRNEVRSCTAPVNRGSIRFHSRMGFEMVPGDKVVDGVPIHLDYNGPGDEKVLFRKRL